MQFILADLDAAVNSNLPVKRIQDDYGRVTLGAAYALRGKVYLYTKEYAKAAKDFEEIILDPSGRGYNYSLYADYAKLFTPEGDQSDEMIFAIQNSGGVGKDYGMPMTFYMGSRHSYLSASQGLLHGSIPCVRPVHPGHYPSASAFLLH